MQEEPTAKTALSLSQLNGLIKAAITDTLPDTYWVGAEIADIKLNQTGHCYLELVEKDSTFRTVVILILSRPRSVFRLETEHAAWVGGFVAWLAACREAQWNRRSSW